MVRNPMLQTMLQNALADRCKMAVHRVPMQIDGYALVLANHGPNAKNLLESKPDEAIPDREIKIDLGGRTIPISSPEDPVLRFYQTSMASLVLMLSGPNGPLIIAISIPLSILSSVILLSLLHVTINIMTLGRLALAVGILGDDPTVDIRN